MKNNFWPYIEYLTYISNRFLFTHLYQYGISIYVLNNLSIYQSINLSWFIHSNLSINLCLYLPWFIYRHQPIDISLFIAICRSIYCYLSFSVHSNLSINLCMYIFVFMSVSVYPNLFILPSSFLYIYQFTLRSWIDKPLTNKLSVT